MTQRAFVLQQELHNLRLNAENVVPRLEEALEKNRQLPMPERQAALMPLLLPLTEQLGTSGAFFIWAPSGAGQTEGLEFLYLRDTRPQVNDPAYRDLMFRGGCAQAARAYKIPMESSWWNTLILSEENGAFYQKPVQALDASGDPSRCGYFSNVFRLTPDDHSMMTFSLPAVSPEGELLGVFGIELSDAYLQRLLPAEEIPFATAVYLLGRLDKAGVRINDAMLSGGYQDVLMGDCGQTVSLAPASHGIDFVELSFARNLLMLGNIHPISLYQSDDFYFEEDHAQLIGMVQEANFYAGINRIRLRTYCALLLFMLASIGGLLVLGYRIHTRVSVFTRELKQLHEEKDYVPARTNLSDMDAIIERVSALAQKAADGALPPDIFEDFIARTKTFTESERRVFQLYASGNAQREIAELTFTSVNTVKKHTQHIYEKLNISSREELLLYVQLIEKSELRIEGM